MSTYKGYGLVRDKNGVPRVDDPATLHAVQIMMLTVEEREALGLWTGPFVLDAQGQKRVRATDTGYEAVDNLIAAGVLIEDSGQYKFPHRIDVLSGATFNFVKGA